MPIIVLVSRYGSGQYDEAHLIPLTKGEDKQIENEAIDKSEFIEERLNLSTGDSWLEIEPNETCIVTITELLFLLMNTKDNKDYSKLILTNKGGTYGINS